MLDETAATAEPDDDLDDAPEQDGTARRVSFFEASNVLDVSVHDHVAWDEIEEADAAVCARVWEIFAKDSTARGFDARSAHSIRATLAMARRRAAGGNVPGGPHPWKRKTETDERKQEAKMKREDFARAHAAYVDAHGELPTAAQLFEAIGPDAGTIANVRQSVKRVGLTLAGSRGPQGAASALPALTGKAKSGRAGGTASAKARAAKVATPAPAPASVPMGLGAMLDELVAKREALAASVAKLDVAIEELRAAS